MTDCRSPRRCQSSAPSAAPPLASAPTSATTATATTTAATTASWQSEAALGPLARLGLVGQRQRWQQRRQNPAADATTQTG